MLASRYLSSDQQVMNWVRLLEVIAMAFARTGREPKVDRGWGWVCYCAVCRELRDLV